MAQHFLLSAAARTLSLKTIFSEAEDAAYRRFRRLRWPETDGAPVCPVCGCLDIYDLTTRRRFKCAACHHQFSVTPGTILASRKLSFVDLLGAICLFVNASKGLSAVQLSRDLDVRSGTSYKTRLRAGMHKLREVHMAADDTAGYAAQRPCGSGRRRLRRACPACECSQRPRRSPPAAKPQRQARRVVVALRQRGGSTLTRTFLREAEGVGFARERIAPGSTISADEIAHDIEPWAGTVSSRGSMFTASTIPTPTAATASTPIWRKVSLPGSGAWSAGSQPSPQSWRPASWRLCRARRLVGGSSRSG